MNSYMTTSTQDSKVLYIIYLMRWIDVMNIQFLLSFFTYKAFVRVGHKSPFPIQARSFSVVRIFLFRALESKKNYLFTFFRTKFQISSIFSCKNFSTFRTGFRNFGRTLFTPFKKAISSTKCTSLIFRSGDIRGSLCKFFITKSTGNVYTPRSRRFITYSGAEFCSIFFKRLFACGTLLHMWNIPLAMANVNTRTSGGLNG